MLKFIIGFILILFGTITAIGGHIDPIISAFCFGCGIGMMGPGDEPDYYSRDGDEQ